jgi:hypothetical protein
MAGMFSLAYDIYLSKILRCKVIDSTSFLLQKAVDKGWDKFLNYN